MSEKFPTYNNQEMAREEAVNMAEKIKSGEAKDYNEAEKITEIKKILAPDGWLTRFSISKQLQAGQSTIKRNADKYRDAHPEWFKEFKNQQGKTFEYYSPELVKIIKDETENKKQNKNNAINKDFDNYAKEISDGKTVTAQEFSNLVGLFGSSRVFDIIYKHHPQFKGVPLERIKSVLPQYLGNYLLTKPPFSIDDIKNFTGYLSEQTLQEGLFEVVKEDALKFYNKKRRGKKEAADPVDPRSVFEKYIQNLKEKTGPIKNDDLNQVIKKIEEYYSSLFNDFKKPDNVVGFLKKDRVFPDVNQLINIKEISDNKKMLIADDVGLGKSASVILTKEILSLKRAIIIAPSNVVEMNTWQDYLSDKISKEGKQVGYFKNGMAPNVLVIKSFDDVNDSNFSSYDYIIISQEKLRDDYVGRLKEMDYDMLVFDEVHKLKNLKKGKRAKGAVELSEKINGSEKYLALLSGTPVPNKIKDLAITLKLLYPEKFTDIRNKDLVKQIVMGDIVDLRNLLIPKMQMKELAESIKMPSKTERLIETEMSKKCKEIYEILIGEDEITAVEKIKIFRQFLLNPKIFSISPETENSKLKNVENFLKQTFEEKNKVVMFINGYVEGVIRGENSIIKEMKLDGVEIRTIDGSIKNKERNAIQKEFKESLGKMLLVVSGQTADVGVDFSSGESVVFYNEPWSRYDEKQQAGRVYREGVKNDIDVNIFITKDSIEEGIHEYIRTKERSVEKLLKGIPLTDMEKEHLLEDEKQNDANVERNPELARYYFNSWDRMLKIFAHIKEMGEKDFLNFINEYGKEYAKCYADLGGRSYQSNTARVIGAVISRLVEENRQNNNDLRILDIASGPEMLKQHTLEKYQDRIFSIDVNEHHFEGSEGGKMVVGSFFNLPIKDKTFDYANLSLAFHYTENKKPYAERIKALSEMNRVLKVGGVALISLIYSLDLRDEEGFKKIIDNLGFKVVENYSGQVNSGDNYKSRLIMLEKMADISIKENKNINDDIVEGLNLDKTDEVIKNQRKIIKDFMIGDKKIAINLNDEDYRLLTEEESATNTGESLKKKYGSVEKIPVAELEKYDFTLFQIPSRDKKKYLLFKTLGDKKGCVVIK